MEKLLEGIIVLIAVGAMLGLVYFSGAILTLQQILKVLHEIAARQRAEHRNGREGS